MKIIIPIKTNNQRLPGKNTMILGDKPLYQYLFDTVKLCNFEVFIDSSDKNILSLAKKNGFNAIERDVKLNSPETSGNDLIYNALEVIGCKDDDIIGQFFVTTPFIKKDTINKSFNILNKNKEKTSCFGLYPVFDRFWMNNKPINHSKNILVGTQYMKPLMREAGFYTFRAGAFKDEGSRITKDFITFNVDELECVDIDTNSDFLYARSLVISMGGF